MVLVSNEAITGLRTYNGTKAKKIRLARLFLYHKIIAGLDETFFGEFIILVLMDLRSGYLLLEEVSDDRCFDIWYEKTTPRLESLGLEVNHVVSDRAGH